MDWLIIGAGYVGERVADLATQKGIPVITVTANPQSSARLNSIKPYQTQSADVSNRSDVSRLAETLEFMPTHVVHCASSGRGGAEAYERVFWQGIQNLADLFPAARLAFTSSSSVYGQIDGSEVDEASEADPTTATSKILRTVEEFLSSKQGLILRLAGIYGPNRSHPLKQFLNQTASIEGNHGQGKYLNQIHREDAARAIVHLLQIHAEGIYNISDNTPMTQLEFYEALAKRFALPVPASTEVVTERKRAWTHKKVSNAKLLATGFQCLYPSFFDALNRDESFLPSILAQVENR